MSDTDYTARRRIDAANSDISNLKYQQDRDRRAFAQLKEEFEKIKRDQSKILENQERMTKALERLTQAVQTLHSDISPRLDKPKKLSPPKNA